MRVMQRRGLCQLSRYGRDPQCLQRPEYMIFVRSRRDASVIGVDVVCHGHREMIMEYRRALYARHGCRIPLMWAAKIKKGNGS
jgi:hypothetical protein